MINMTIPIMRQRTLVDAVRLPASVVATSEEEVLPELFKLIPRVAAELACPLRRF
jgi:hypothetical protein